MSLHISPAPTSHTLVQAASTGLSPALAPKPPDPAVLSVPPCPAASAKPPLPAGSAEPPVPGEAFEPPVPPDAPEPPVPAIIAPPLEPAGLAEPPEPPVFVWPLMPAPPAAGPLAASPSPLGFQLSITGHMQASYVRSARQRRTPLLLSGHAHSSCTPGWHSPAADPFMA